MMSVNHSSTHVFSVDLYVELLCIQISDENHQQRIFDQKCMHGRTDTEVGGIESL